MAITPPVAAADLLAPEAAAASQQRHQKCFVMHSFKAGASADEFDTPQGLPPGWKRRSVMRKSGASAGQHDVYYYR